MKSKQTIAAPFTAALFSIGALVALSPTVAAAQEDSPWHGFYAGVNAGGSWSNSEGDATLSINPSAPIPGHPISGGDITAINNASVKRKLDSDHHGTFTGGLEAGYNYVMGSNILVGIETDINFFDIKRFDDRPIVGPSGGSYNVRQGVDTDFLWTLRPRIGYAMDNILIFASGGLALTKAKYSMEFVDNQTGGTSTVFEKTKTRTGWTIGGGGAYAFTPNISAKAEYLYQDFGNEPFSTTSANGYLTLDTNTHLRSHLFRAGIDYRF